MKNGIILTVLLLLVSCVQDIPPLPKEPCGDASMETSPVITNGFSVPEYNWVTVETYTKNSKFNHLQKSYKIELGRVDDTLRQQRDLVLPKEITTGFDLKIIFNKNVFFNITEMKSAWVGQYRKPFIGYDCELVSYKLNGISKGYSNMFIENSRLNKSKSQKTKNSSIPI